MKYEGSMGSLEVVQTEPGGDYTETIINAQGGNWDMMEAYPSQGGTKLKIRGHIEWDDFLRFMAKVAAQEGLCILNPETHPISRMQKLLQVM